MCYYRASSLSDDKAKAEADRQKEASAKRTETVGNLLHEADKAAKVAPEAVPAKESVPAK